MTSAPFCAPQLNCCPTPFCFDPGLLAVPAGLITEEGEQMLTEDGDTISPE